MHVCVYVCLQTIDTSMEVTPLAWYLADDSEQSRDWASREWNLRLTSFVCVRTYQYSKCLPFTLSHSLTLSLFVVIQYLCIPIQIAEINLEWRRNTSSEKLLELDVNGFCHREECIRWGKEGSSAE